MCRDSTALFPGHSHLQCLIACSMQVQRREDQTHGGWCLTVIVPISYQLVLCIVNGLPGLSLNRLTLHRSHDLWRSLVGGSEGPRLLPFRIPKLSHDWGRSARGESSDQPNSDHIQGIPGLETKPETPRMEDCKVTHTQQRHHHPPSSSLTTPMLSLN